ncbi:MFS transporter [Balneolales bacterium ANBcel1]|nr:MFS transporter [Balneolales bacterium ANBcel1]
MSKLQPYLHVLRSNHQFRRVWLSQIISNFGDWFGVIAVFTIVLEYSDSEFLLGLVIVTKFLAFAALSPYAGYLADRYDRRMLMIICDFGRGAVVLSFLFVRDPSLLWLVYVLTTMQMGFASIFEPAKQASIPNITSGDELVKANIISNLSWSIIFTTGMGIGGLATAWFGTDAVFVINGTGYILSTWFIFKATIPHHRDEQTMQSLSNPVSGIIDGYRFIFSNPHILRPALAKGTITFFLGALVYMLILVSEEILLMGSIGLGLLYASRGFGTAVGPVLVRRYFSDERNWVRMMGLAMISAGLFYLVIGSIGIAWVMLILVFLAHCGSGANWVMSTVLLQQRSPDAFRGRIFSSEWLLFTSLQALSVTGASLIMEFGLLTLRQAIWIYSAGLIIAGVLWIWLVASRESRWNRMKEAHARQEDMRKHQISAVPDQG